MPDWLRKVIPRKSATHSHLGYMLHYPKQGEVHFSPTMALNKGNLGTRTLFMVCHSCNTGWMRDSQDEARPLLIPLIEGQWRDLTQEEGRIIAFWAAMTASVIALSLPTKGVTQADRTFMREKRSIPANWYVWLGRGSGFEDIDYSNRIHGVYDRSQFSIPPPEANTTITTIALRKLLVHAVNIPQCEVSPDSVAYGRELGVFPVHPWGGTHLPQPWIPIIPSGSPAFTRLKDQYDTDIRAWGRERPVV